MEMMEINEGLMELEFEFDQQAYDGLREQVKNLEEQLFNAIFPVLRSYEYDKADPSDLQSVKEFYLKKRYLLRILENLDRFAPASKEAGNN